MSFLSDIHGQGENDYVQYTVNDGLPSNNVYQALQDKKGYMWFATEGGVAKFDGREFKKFTVKDGLPSNDIYQIVEDEVGRIWLKGASSTACYIERDSVKIFTPLSESDVKIFGKLISIEYRDKVVLNYRNCKIVVDSKLDETLLCEDAYTYEFGKFLGNIDSIYSFYGHYIDVNRHFVMVDNDLFIYNRSSNIIDTIQTNKLLVHKSSISHGNFYYYNDRLFHLSIDESELYIINTKLKEVTDLIKIDSLLDGKPSHIRFEWLDNTLQIQSNLGVITLNQNDSIATNDVQVFTTGRLSNAMYVNRVFLDRSSNLWICTRNEGVKLIPFFRVDELSTTYRNVKNLSSLLQYQDDLFLGTKDGQLFILGENNFNVNLSSNESDNSISQMTYDSTKNELRFIKDGLGLTFYDPISHEVSLFFDHNNLFNFECQLESDFSYYYKGVRRTLTLNKTKNAFSYNISANRMLYMSANLLIDYNIEKCEIDTVLYSPVNEFIDNVSTYFLISDDYITLTDTLFNELNKVVFNSSIVDVEPFNEGVLVLLDNADLIYIADDVQYRYSYSDSIHPNNCRKLMLADGNVWISTSTGVYTYSMDDFDLNLTRYEIMHGVNDFILKEDTLIAATDMGLVRSQFANYDDHKLLCPIHIRVTDLQDSKILDDNNQLDHDQNNLKFHFDILEYSTLGEYSIDLSLIGSDTVQFKTSENNIILPNLVSDDYLLEYTITDALGRKSTMSSFHFTINKPWWLRYWVIGLFILFVACLSVIIYMIAMQRLRKREEAKSIVAKKMAELRLSALQSQMNPHFIFNSLNSIQYLIQIKDAENADKYLSKFSELLRSFLENSREKFVPINKELTLLHNYCKLELLRFENKISLDYKIELTETEQSKYLISTSILQPIVENAVVHGLFHKSEMGLLSILVRIVGKQLEVQIKDNGVGRKKSKELNKKRNKGHQSLGGKLILEKLEVLEKIDSYQVSIQYVDLFNDVKESIGTEVLIRMPLKESDRVELIYNKSPYN